MAKTYKINKGKVTFNPDTGEVAVVINLEINDTGVVTTYAHTDQLDGIVATNYNYVPDINEATGATPYDAPTP